MTVIKIAEAVRSGQTSAKEVVTNYLEHVAANNSEVNAFVHIDADIALQTAAKVDAKVRDGQDPGPFAGVPFGAKDLSDHVCGMPTRKGSLFLKDAKPEEHDSPHIKRLKNAGAIPIGKVATAEFGMDGVTHTKAHGTTRNPWNRNKTPGGSSGGSAAAVSAGLVPFCTASDGGGSTRCPAGYTGTVGLKPSLGRVPRINGFSDRSCPGVITTTVADTARYLGVASGPSPDDRMTLPPQNTNYEACIERLSTKGLKARFSVDLGFAPVNEEVAAIVTSAASDLIAAAELQLDERPIKLTNTYMPSNYLMTRDFVRMLEHEKLIPDQQHMLSGFPRYMVESFLQLTEKELFEMSLLEKQLEQEVGTLFAETDIVLTPTSGTAAFSAKGPMPEIIAGRCAKETHGDAFTVFSSIYWNPSISIPAGITSDGLPVGLLITGPRHRDDIVLRLARIMELTRPWPHHPDMYCMEG